MWNMEVFCTFHLLRFNENTVVFIIVQEKNMVNKTDKSAFYYSR